MSFSISTLEICLRARKILSSQTSYILTDLMQDVINNGTGKKAKFINSKMPIAGKTGTTSDTKDLNFVGYTPYYVASIWFGFDHPKKMYASYGYHLSLWRDTMEKIHSKLFLKNFDKPDSLKKIKICKETGKIACDDCTRVSDEYFIIGTEPSEVCDFHERKDKDKEIYNNKDIETNNNNNIKDNVENSEQLDDREEILDEDSDLNEELDDEKKFAEENNKENNQQDILEDTFLRIN